MLRFGINEKGYRKQLEKENKYFRDHLETIELIGYKSRVLDWKHEDEVKYAWSCYPEIKDRRTNKNFYEYFGIENDYNKDNAQIELLNKEKEILELKLQLEQERSRSK
ncbi:hypothetical protein [Spiroplasma melliferum]|uniref:hypothetical protein n=1 Tax=Spiroplasma melliferum TaxID=2134 RepID=UPI0011AF4AD9|nr:hypothetical protein [Spiroplasma melliferum]